MVTLAEMADNARFFFEEPTLDPKAVEKHIQNNNGLNFLKDSLAILSPILESEWNKTALAGPMDKILALGMNAIGAQGKRGAAAQPIRVAISGNSVTPTLLETLALLGREKPSPASPAH